MVTVGTLLAQPAVVSASRATAASITGNLVISDAEVIIRSFLNTSDYLNLWLVIRAEKPGVASVILIRISSVNQYVSVRILNLRVYEIVTTVGSPFNMTIHKILVITIAMYVVVVARLSTKFN